MARADRMYYFATLGLYVALADEYWLFDPADIARPESGWGGPDPAALSDILEWSLNQHYSVPREGFRNVDTERWMDGFTDNFIPDIWDLARTHRESHPQLQGWQWLNYLYYQSAGRIVGEFQRLMEDEAIHHSEYYGLYQEQAGNTEAIRQAFLSHHPGNLQLGEAGDVVARIIEAHAKQAARSWVEYVMTSAVGSDFFSQAAYDIKCEWGLKGVEALAPVSDVLIIVDVISFTTCVDVAVSRGAAIYPYATRDESIQRFAESVGALVAGSISPPSGYALSPSSLRDIPAGARLVLPSPNGSALSLATGNVPTFAGCLRNAKAVAEAAMRVGKRISVIPAGERWKDDHTLRPALEDWIGAGAIIHHLRGSRSPEAWGAAALFRDAARKGLEGLLLECSSGRESTEKGRAEDVRLAAMLDASACAPVLRDGAYIAFEAAG